MRKEPRRVLEDRQRIYVAIIQRLASDVLCRKPWVNPRDAVPGDLVVSSTRRGWDPWLAGFLVEQRGDYGAYLIRDVASPRVCTVSNDSFHVVRGLMSEDLLAGYQYAAARRCRGALSVGWRSGAFDSLDARWGGIEFADRDTRDGVLYVRPHSFFGPHCPPRGPLPEGKHPLGTKGVSESDQWRIVTEHKAIPFHATSRLRARDLAARIEEALTTPYNYFAIPYSWNPGGGFGRAMSLHHPAHCPDAVAIV